MFSVSFVRPLGIRTGPEFCEFSESLEKRARPIFHEYELGRDMRAKPRDRYTAAHALTDDGVDGSALISHRAARHRG
jgi:hypothetical protein